MHQGQVKMNDHKESELRGCFFLYTKVVIKINMQWYYRNITCTVAAFTFFRLVLQLESTNAIKYDLFIYALIEL